MDDAIAGLDVKLNDLGRGLRRANRHAFAKDVVDCSLDSQGSSIKCFKGCRAVRNPEGNDNIKLCHNLRSIPDCFVSHQVPLEDTRERIWVLQQPVKGLVANLGKGAVGRGEEGEGGSSVQDVGGGAVVEGGSEGGHQGGEAVVGGQGLVQAERARGGLGGDYSWGLGEGGVRREGYGVIWKRYRVSRERDWVRIVRVRGERYRVRI